MNHITCSFRNMDPVGYLKDYLEFKLGYAFSGLQTDPVYANFTISYSRADLVTVAGAVVDCFGNHFSSLCTAEEPMDATKAALEVILSQAIEHHKHLYHDEPVVFSYMSRAQGG